MILLFCSEFLVFGRLLLHLYLGAVRQVRVARGHHLHARCQTSSYLIAVLQATAKLHLAELHCAVRLQCIYIAQTATHLLLDGTVAQHHTATRTEVEYYTREHT